MKHQEFEEFARTLDEEGYRVGAQATLEYASEEDKFTNFKILAALARLNPRMKDILPEDVAWILRLKHIVSQIKDVSLREDMMGRTVDDLNYGKLIAGMRKERLDKVKDAVREFMQEHPNEPVQGRQIKQRDVDFYEGGYIDDGGMYVA